MKWYGEVSLFLLFIFLVRGVSSCPTICSCKWKGGKRTADCRGRNLTSVPEGIDPATQTIDLAANRLLKLPERMFSDMGLVNLQRIYLSGCGLREVADTAFFQLSNAVEIDMSNNMLQRVPSVALKSCQLLRRLHLTVNPIKRLHSNEFCSLVHLIFLDLSNCNIQVIEPGAFDGLVSLEFLKLDGNNLFSVPASSLVVLSRLYQIYLHNNPWLCDCDLYEVRKWSDEHNVPLGVPPKCHGPSKLSGITWDMMTLKDYTCAPSVQSSDEMVHVEPGDNLTLTCRARSLPDSSITWKILGRTVIKFTSGSAMDNKYVVRERKENDLLKSSLLTVTRTEMRDSGFYVCLAKNEYGEDEANFSVTVTPTESLSQAATGWSRADVVLVATGLFLTVVMIVVVLFMLFLHPGLRHSNSCSPKSTQIIEGPMAEENGIRNGGPQDSSSSGYGSDQHPTPDLATRGMESAPPYQESLARYCLLPVGNWKTSEGCVQDDMDQSHCHQHVLPEHQRVRTLRETDADVSHNLQDPAYVKWKRSPMVESGTVHFAQPIVARFSPDEGFGEGTEV